MDQLTDGLNSAEPSVVCSTLSTFHDEVYEDYITSGGYGDGDGGVWKCPLAPPTGLLLEYCTASPEFVELMTVWKLGTEEVCTELVALLALMLSVGRHEALTKVTKQILKDRVHDVYANIVDTNSPLACPGLALFAAIAKQGLIATGALLTSLKVNLKTLLRSIAASAPQARKGGRAKKSAAALSGQWKLRVQGVRFLLSLLRCGAPDIQQEVLEHKGFINTLVTGLPHDHVESVQDTLETLKNCVLNNAKLPRSLKKRVFGAMVVRTLVELVSNNHCTGHPYPPRRRAGPGVGTPTPRGDGAAEGGPRSRASMMGMECLHNTLCGDGASFFSSWKDASGDGGKSRSAGGASSRPQSCSPLLLEVALKLLPLRFDNHRSLLLDVFRAHPMVIEKYLRRSPLAIEPKPTAAWPRR